MTNLIHFLRLLQRNLKWMFVMAFIMAVAVFFFTRDMPKEYQSETEIFTGITSGMSIDNMDGAKMDFFAANNAFDNLINIIKSRQTIEEVGMRLLAEHLMIDTPTVNIISDDSWEQLNEWVSEEKRKELVVLNDTDSTYLNILNWYKSEFYSDEVGALFNNGDSPYCYKSIERVTVARLQNSDLLRLSHTYTDPAIAQRTLVILNKVFIRLVADIKVARTNDIVAYFRAQVNRADQRLNAAEEKLKVFKTENRVINYGEQTKSIAMMKEYMEDEYQKELASKASAQAVVAKLEVQLSSNKEMLKYSESLLSRRQKLVELNSEIAVLEVYLNDEKKLADMRSQAEKIKAEMSRDLSNRMEYSRTTEGLPVKKLLEEWLEYTLALDRVNASIEVYEDRKVYFGETYDEFSVIGSTIGKLEREITIEEKNYLELLHSLNLALMRVSSETLSSDGLIVTMEPFFPLTPLPAKRLLLVMLSFIIGFVLPYVWGVLKDILDLSIKTGLRLEKVSKSKHIGSMPWQKIVESQSLLDSGEFKSKYIRLIWSKIEAEKEGSSDEPILINWMSLHKQEGKSYTAELVKFELEKMGVSVLHLQPNETTYLVNDALNQVTLLEELTDENVSDFTVVILEHPALIESSYSKVLASKGTVNVLVNWVGRVWGVADTRKLEELNDVSDHKAIVLLNGADLDEMETMVGDIPKERSWIHKKLKGLSRFQFTSSVASAS
jgi:succinoglycan biosynthesis transport protein ExoP